MIYLALCLLCVIAIESFLFLPVMAQVKKLAAVSQKSLKVISSPRISDHWKEKVLQRYSRDMAVASLAIAVGLALMFVPVIAASYLFDAFMDGEISILDYAVTTEGLVIATLFSIFYAYVRSRLVSS
jgi:cytochrome c biogenesis protein CcdA